MFLFILALLAPFPFLNGESPFSSFDVVSPPHMCYFTLVNGGFRLFSKLCIGFIFPLEFLVVLSGLAVNTCYLQVFFFTTHFSLLILISKNCNGFLAFFCKLIETWCCSGLIRNKSYSLLRELGMLAGDISTFPKFHEPALPCAPRTSCRFSCASVLASAKGCGLPPRPWPLSPRPNSEPQRPFLAVQR